MRTCSFLVRKHKSMLIYICFPVFSPFSAHFYPPLHHNGKGSIHAVCVLVSFPGPSKNGMEPGISFSSSDSQGRKDLIVHGKLSDIGCGKPAWESDPTHVYLVEMGVYCSQRQEHHRRESWWQ